MGADDGQALKTHVNKDRSKREDHPIKRPQRFQKNHRSQKDYSNLRCFTCDEKCHFAKDCPRNKGPTRTNKKRHYAHIVEEGEIFMTTLNGLPKSWD